MTSPDEARCELCMHRLCDHALSAQGDGVFCEQDDCECRRVFVAPELAGPDRLRWWAQFHACSGDPMMRKALDVLALLDERDLLETASAVFEVLVGELRAENALRLQECTRLRSDMRFWTQRAERTEAENARLRAAMEPFLKFVAVHAGAEVARRLIVAGIEGSTGGPPMPAHVIVYLQDMLDALDGGSRKRGLRAIGDTPEERIASGKSFAAAARDAGTEAS